MHSIRTQCHQFLGEARLLQTDYDHSIRMAPNQPRWYLNRAQFWEQQGNHQLAEADRRRANELRNNGAPAKPESPRLPDLPAISRSPFDDSF